LDGELAQQIHPGTLSRPRGRRRRRDGDHPLDDLDGAASGGRGPSLLPGPVPAGGRAPLRNRSTRPRGDLPVAPTTRRGRCPPRRRPREVLCRRTVRRRLSRWGSFPLLTMPTFALTLKCAVLAAPLTAHSPERAR
jgi:hypothetical protein